MPPTIPLPARARCARGSVSWVTLLMTAALASGVYLAWVWVPVYLVQAEVKQVVQDYMNQAVKNHNDSELIEKMTHKLRVLDEQEVVQDDGSVGRVPVVDVAPADVVWEVDRTSKPPTLHVAFEYTREVHFPYLERVSEKTFAIDMTEDISVPDWGPAR